MHASILLAGVALLCATTASAEPGPSRTIYVEPEKFARPVIFDRPVEAERNVRVRRDALMTPAPSRPSNISTWMNRLNDSHQQLMVHWVGEGSRVIVCLARDPAPRKLSPPAPSALYISYDYGANFTNKTESFRLSDNSTLYAQLDKFFNHPKYPQYCIFVDASNKLLFYTSDNGITIGRTVLDFVPSDLAFHQHYPDRFIIHDKVDPMKKLYMTTDGGRTFTLAQEFVKSFNWVWRDGDTEGALYYERMEPNRAGELVRHSPSSPRAVPLLADIQDFHVKGEFMFATHSKKDGSAQLMISHSRGPFAPAEFETELPLLKFHVADVTESRLMVSVMHAENLTSLYVSRINANFTQYKFALSLPAVMGYFPFATWKDSWLEGVAEEAFTDVYRVEGIRGVYVASRITAAPAAGNIGTEHLASVISFDHGATWAPITPPAEDENGVPILCRQEYSCSLHLSQKFSQLYPVTRSASIMSSKSAPGIIMATGVLGKSMKGIPGVYLSRDAGVTWKRVLKDYYFFNAGDHGGVLVAVKYFKSRGETRRILYSTDEGRTWSSHQFFSDDLRVYGLMTEPGENTTTFTMFGSAKDHHQWIIITVDLMNAFARNCTPGDYKLWSPAAPNSSVSCVLGARDTYQRRLAHTNCYNGIDYDRPVKKQFCECSRSDYECDYGFLLSGSECVRNKSSRHDPYAVPISCRPGQFYRRTKGYRKIDGDVCTNADYIPYDPDSIPCPMGESTEFLVVALRDKIARIDLETNETTLFAIKNLKNIVAIEFDLKNNCIYWADIERDMIGRQCLANGTSTQEFIVSTDLASIEGMALDWVSNVLFFVDGLRVKIEAIRTDLSNSGRMRRTILDSKNMVKPRGIAVHPKAGYLFWTDWDADNPSISRANLDGSNIRKLFGKPLVQWPNGITIDQISERIYWVDAMSDYIASADLNGQYLKKVLFNDERVAHPFAVAVLKDRMYWDDWKAGAIFSADKDRGTEIITLPTSNSSLSGLMDLKVFAHFTQYGSNACAWRNTSCPALCLGGPRSTYSCLCPDGLTGRNGHCMCPDGAVPNANMTCPMKADSCAPKEWRCTNGLCVSEAWRCDGDNDCGDGSDERGCGRTCAPPMISCDRGRRCLPPHWACDREVDCLDRTDETNCQKHNCSASEFACANGQCIDQKWRCDGDSDCKDGSDELGCPALKPPGECRDGDFHCPNSTRCIPISWKCDGEKDCVGAADESPETCANSTCSDNMFRCAGNGKCIFKAWVCDHEDDCVDGLSSDEQNCTFTTEIVRPTTVAPPHMMPTNTCVDWMFLCGNGACVPAWWKCDQINDCGDGSDEIGCDYEREQDNTSSEHVPSNNEGTCDSLHFTCSPGVCIPLEWVCDTATDCPNGADELECRYQHVATGEPPTAPRCAPEDFLCVDRTKCIPADEICDGTAQCADRSDETNCPDKQKSSWLGHCAPGQFSCDKGLHCFALAAVCDKHQDCYDASDEANCTDEAPLYKNLGLGVDQHSINSHGFLISCWLAQQKNVTYWFLPSISPVGSSVWRNMSFSNDTTYQFSDLEPYTEYNVTIYIRDSLTNKTVHSGIYVNATTTEGEPSPPRNLVVRQLPGRAVSAEWLPPAEPRGTIVDYTVLYYSVGPDLSKDVFYQTPNTSAIIEGDFVPNTSYIFKVFAFNGKDQSNFSEPATLEFDSLDDVDELTNVSAKRLNDSAITLSWSAIRGVDGYRISLNLPFQYPEPLPINTTKTTLTLTELPLGVPVNVRVRAYIGKVEGRPFTIPLKPHGVNDEMLKLTGALADGQSTAVEMHWTQPISARYANKSLVYHVFYSDQASYSTSIFHGPPQIETRNTSVLVTGLHPCRSYYLSVGLKGGPLAHPLFIVTGYDNPTAEVGSVKARVYDITAKLRVTWTAPCSSISAPVTYRVEVTEVNVASGQQSRSHYRPAPSTDVTLQHTIDHIPPGASFNVCVWVEGSSAAHKCAQARSTPLPPPSGVLAWLAPHGHLMVSWRAPDATHSPTAPDQTYTYEILVSEHEMVRGAGADLSDATMLPARSSPHLAVLPISARALYVAVRTRSANGYCSDLSEVTTLPIEGDAEGEWRPAAGAVGAASAEGGGGWSGAWWWAGGACAALLVAAAALLHLALRHRRLSHSFLRFAAHRPAPPHPPHVSRYDSRRGQATIADHEDDETPNIHGFSDDEPLVIA